MGGILIRGVRHFTADGVIDSYEPRHRLDDGVMKMLRDATRATQPVTPHAAWSTLTTACRFAQTAESLGWPMDPVLLFTSRNIEWHCRKALTTVHPEVRATARSRLRRIARAVSSKHGLSIDGEKYARRPQSAVYPSACMYDFESLIPLQSTAYRSRILRAFLALCAGAGVRSQELVVITAAHVRRDGRFVLVDIPGAKARTVPVRRHYERMLLSLIEDVPDGVLLGNVTDPVRSPVHHLRTAIEIPDRLPSLSASRLRATWIAQCLHDNVPFSTLMHAAGVNDLRLRDWLPYVDNRPAPEVERAHLAGDLS